MKEDAHMRIANLFERDIFRPINGVVKADQMDEASVWQELDEFVITKELDQHVRRFVSWFLEAVDQRDANVAASESSIVPAPQSGAHARRPE